MKETARKAIDQQRANLGTLYRQLQEMAKTTKRTGHARPNRDLDLRAPVLLIRGK